jgi:hypothetical protein
VHLAASVIAGIRNPSHQLTFKPVKYGIEVAEKSNQQRLHGSVAQT